MTLSSDRFKGKTRTTELPRRMKDQIKIFINIEERQKNRVFKGKVLLLNIKNEIIFSLKIKLIS